MPARSLCGGAYRLAVLFAFGLRAVPALAAADPFSSNAAILAPRDVRWVELASPARTEAATAFDVGGRRLIVIGGRAGPETVHRVDATNDVWILKVSGAARWERIVPRGTPPSPRFGAVAVWDALHDRVLVFGGQDSSRRLRNDLWELSLGSQPRWRELRPAGRVPPARFRATATLDAGGGRAIVIGGEGTGLYEVDVWQLDLAPRLAWTRIEPTGPTPYPRSAHSAVLVPSLGGIVVLGGNNAYRCLYPPCPRGMADAWLLSLEGRPAWVDLTARMSGDGPCAGIVGHAAAYDPVDDAMIIIEGAVPNPSSPCYGANSDVWRLAIADLTWSHAEVASRAPPARTFGSIAWDPQERQLIVSGGGAPLGDAWALRLGDVPAWTPLVEGASVARGGLAYDARDDVLISYDGGHVWRYGSDARWTASAISGDAALPREPASIFDPIRRRFVIHGGFDVQRGYVSDTWALNVDGTPSWSRVAVTGPEPVGQQATAVYDPVRDRMIVCGGVRTWALRLGAAAEWTVIDSSGGPGQRFSVGAVYDPVRDRLIVIGGGQSSGDGRIAFNDTWALPLSGDGRWRQLDAGGYRPGELPYPRMLHVLVHDPVADRLLMIGGYVPGTFTGVYPDDMWEFRLDDRTWRLVPAPSGFLPPWMSPRAVYDSRHRRIVTIENAWMWALDLERDRKRTSQRVERPVALVDDAAPSMRLLGPNPFGESFVVQLALRVGSTARLDLFDIAGRRIWSNTLAAGAGRAPRVEIDGLQSVPPGIVILRLTQGRDIRTLRLVRGARQGM